MRRLLTAVTVLALALAACEAADTDDGVPDFADGAEVLEAAGICEGEAEPVDEGLWRCPTGEPDSFYVLLEPGDSLHLDAPPSWPAVTVALAAWWAGVAITLDGDAEIAVVQAGRPAPPDAEVFRLGDAIDGAPDGDTGDEPWVRAVQAYPDQPPTPRAGGDMPALTVGGATWTQGQLLAAGDATEDDIDAAAGPVGIEVPVDAHLDRLTLVDLALRPLLTGRPTVVARGVGRDAAAGDRVAVWR